MSDRRPRGGLSRHFERVCVITLERRPERRARLEAHLEVRGLGRGVEWTAAVDGQAEQPPEGWGSGPGAWGCRLSHLAVLRRALADKVEHILVLEDDVVFSPHTAALLPSFLKELPADWGQFYLGGQHLKNPVEAVSPLIWRSTNINRTHAFAVHRRALPAVIAHLERLGDYLRRGQWHVDHQLGTGQESYKWQTYAPSWWLAGQAEGESDIAGNAPEERWWHHQRYALSLPLVVVPPKAKLSGGKATALCFDPEPKRAEAAAAALTSRPLDFFVWCRGLAEHCLVRGLLPACRLPKSRAASVIWPAGCLQWPDALPAAPADYPFNKLFAHPAAKKLP